MIRSEETGEEREIIAKTLVSPPYRQAQLRWSPDGRSILSARDLQLINVQTGDVTSIVQFDLADRIAIKDAEWSHDGKTIFYIRVVQSSEQWPHSIVAHDLETGEEKELYQGNIWQGSLAISPDGQRLVFTDGHALKVMPAAGGEPRVLHRVQDTEGEAVDYGFAWTADGRYILEMHIPDQSGPTELWRMPTEGGKLQKVLEMDGLMIDISIHPDGRRIAFTREQGGMEVWAMENFLPLD